MCGETLRWRFALHAHWRSSLVHWRGIDGGGGRVQLYVGGALRQTFAGFNPTARRWIHVAFDVKIDPSAGWVKLYFNGIEGMSYTGNTGDTDIVRLRFSKGISGFLTTAGTLYLDDITVNDSTGEPAPACMRDVRYLWAPVSGNGYYADGVGSDGDSADNYQLVDDSATVVHDGDTTYVRLSAVDERESYPVANITLTEGATIKAIIPMTYARKEDGGGSAQLGLALRFNGADATGTGKNLTADYSYVHVCA